MRVLSVSLLVLSCGGCADSPNSAAPGVTLAGAEHLFDRAISTVDVGPAVLPRDVSEALAEDRVWVVGERLTRTRFQLTARGLPHHRTVYRADTSLPIDGPQRRVSVGRAADPDAGTWMDGEPLSAGKAVPGEALIGPDEVLVGVEPGDPAPEELVLSYPVKSDVLLSEVMTRPGRSGDPLATRELTLKDETRRVALLPRGTRVSWILTVPEGAALRTAYGTRSLNLRRAGRGVSVAKSSRVPVHFSVEVRDPGSSAQLTLWERDSVRPETFHDANIDLGDYGGREVELSLVTDVPVEDEDVGRGQAFPFWAEPVVLTRRVDERPNVLLVVIDTLRADRLGCYGWERAETPHLDALAERGVRYSNAWSAAPWTIPSHASLFTSTYVSEHGIWNRWQRVPASETTLAEQLRAGGYDTAAFTGGGFVRAQYGLAQGFDSFVTTPSDDATVGFDRAWDWIRDAGRPFFAFVHTYQVHSPYAPPEPERARLVRTYDGPLPAEVHTPDYAWGRNKKHELTDEDVRFLCDLYDAEIAAVDATVGRLLERLEQAGLADDTLVVVTSDHGEEFDDHGHFAHGMSLYEEQLSVPLIIYWKGHFEGGRVASHPVHGVDLAPTLTAAASTTSPAEWSGIPLATVAPDAARPLFLPFRTRTEGTPAVALRVGNRKYIDFPDSHRPGDSHEGPKLFDLDADPDERENLWDSSDRERWLDAVRELQRRYALRAEAASAGQDGGLSDELKALGYVGDD